MSQLCDVVQRADGEAEVEAGCWPEFDYDVFVPVVRTIMGPHGIGRTIQRLDFSDCRKGLGEL